MLRFDPTQPEHEKFEIKEVATEKKKKRRKDAQNTDLEKIENLPEVSDEKFYKVNEGLKEVFQEKQQFSLLNIFNKYTEECKIYYALLCYLLLLIISNFS